MFYFSLETERLKFRKVKAEDISVWRHFFEDNPNLKYLGLDLSLNAEELSKDWINRQLKRYADTGYGMLSVIRKKR